MSSSAERCCDLGIVEDVLDYSQQLGCAQTFLEQAGLLPSYRNPTPRTAPQAFKIHTVPLQSPLPLPELQHRLAGDPPPDRVQAYDWPHPEF